MSRYYWACNVYDEALFRGSVIHSVRANKHDQDLPGSSEDLYVGLCNFMNGLSAKDRLKHEKSGQALTKIDLVGLQEWNGTVFFFFEIRNLKLYP